MKLAEFQNAVAAAITADTTLETYGAPILVSLHEDDDSQKALIDERLRTTGVVFEIGLPSASDDGSAAGRFTRLAAELDVMVAENPKLAHTPANMELVQRVVQAMTRNPDRDSPMRCSGYDAAKSEKGYVLHVISFSAPVFIA